MTEIFFSIDVESDGPIPGRNSMLSLGCAAFAEDGAMVDKFYANLDHLPEAEPNQDTMKWWALPQNAAAYNATRVDTKRPEVAIRHFAEWVEKTAANHGGKPVCVAYPAGFDFTYVYWYLMAFHGSSPFSFECLDMKSYAMAKLGTEFRQTTKRHMPKAWFAGLPKHTHNALDDAIEQGMLFFRMRNHNG